MSITEHTPNAPYFVFVARYSDSCEPSEYTEYPTKAEAVKAFETYNGRGAWEVENNCEGGMLNVRRADLTWAWEEWVDDGQGFGELLDSDEQTYYARADIEFRAEEVLIPEMWQCEYGTVGLELSAYCIQSGETWASTYAKLDADLTDCDTWSDLDWEIGQHCHDYRQC